jgi:hypothetical protein
MSSVSMVVVVTLVALCVGWFSLRQSGESRPAVAQVSLQMKAEVISRKIRSELRRTHVEKELRRLEREWGHLPQRPLTRPTQIPPASQHPSLGRLRSDGLPTPMSSRDWTSFGLY